MISVNMRQAKELEKSLGNMQIKFAERNTINGQAFATQRNARKHIQRDMITRNRWTVGSVRVDTAKSLRDSAVAGSVERYMANQEFGHTDTQHTAMATPSASGEPSRAKVRRKPVRRANRMSAINLANKPRVQGSRVQQNIAALKDAKAHGRKFVFMQRGKVKGIYKVMGTKKKPRSRMVQNLSRSVAVIPRRPWLRPSIVSQQETASIYFDQMRRQLRRMR